MLETLVALLCVIALPAVAWLTKRLGIDVRPGG